MGKFFEEISPDMHAFIKKQQMFFVASAPLSAYGHVNLSPKGLDSFRVLSSRQVAYLDVTGSGNETSAHLLENGRITLMFIAFEGAPNILRLYGKGRVIRPNQPDWDELAKHFTLHLGTRQIILAEIEKVQTSCGFAVPLYDYQAQRDTLTKWAEAKGEEGIQAYWQQKNLMSIDCLETAIEKEI